ncbi:MAG: hypothetical protein LUE22_04970 [Oscillospiraceae bacterium]|nr:hypothetical protein [Oscillospiraceae bacterium]
MYDYINGIRCTANDGNDEVLLQAFQDAPEYDENDQICGSTRECIASLVMSRQTAKAVADLIYGVLNAEQAEVSPDD